MVLKKLKPNEKVELIPPSISASKITVTNNENHSTPPYTKPELLSSSTFHYMRGFDDSAHSKR